MGYQFVVRTKLVSYLPSFPHWGPAAQHCCFPSQMTSPWGREQSCDRHLQPPEPVGFPPGTSPSVGWLGTGNSSPGPADLDCFFPTKTLGHLRNKGHLGIVHLWDYQNSKNCHTQFHTSFSGIIEVHLTKEIYIYLKCGGNILIYIHTLKQMPELTD